MFERLKDLYGIARKGLKVYVKIRYGVDIDSILKEDKCNGQCEGCSNGRVQD